MTINRKTRDKLLELINKLSKKSFDINTQYNFLILKRELEKDLSIEEEQLETIIELYGEKDENGKYVLTEDGGIKIKSTELGGCQQKIKELNNCKIQVPDIYFTLDELRMLELNLNELEELNPFIKF